MPQRKLTDLQFSVLLRRHSYLRANDRAYLELMLEVLRSGVAWRDAPEEDFGVGWQATYQRYRRWNDQGCVETIIESYLELLPKGQRTAWEAEFECANRIRHRSHGNRKRMLAI
jgi:transposase